MLKRAMLAAIAIALTIPAAIPAAQAQDKDVKFVLDFISLGRHAPWYVALGKGYFKEEGLNVTILPSSPWMDQRPGPVPTSSTFASKSPGLFRISLPTPPSAVFCQRERSCSPRTYGSSASQANLL